jgi:hypothetical protein
MFNHAYPICPRCGARVRRGDSFVWDDQAVCRGCHYELQKLIDRTKAHSLTRSSTGRVEFHRAMVYPVALTGGFVMIGVAPLPLLYYLVLRWIVFLLVCWCLWRTYRSSNIRSSQQVAETWLLSAIGLLFNPIFPAEFSHWVWTRVDFLTGVGLLAIAVANLPQSWRRAGACILIFGAIVVGLLVTVIGNGTAARSRVMPNRSRPLR